MGSAAKSSRSSSRVRSRRRELTDLRRAEIIAAALVVFARKGFASARAEDVAEQAGIAKGTLYLYFASKEAIYEAALKHAMEQLQAMVLDRLAGAAGVEERIRVFVGTRMEFWGAQGELYRMVMTVGREKRQKKRTARIIQESVDHFLTILREGIAAGELLERPVEMMGWAVMDMIRGMNERRVDGLQVTSMEEDTEFVTGTVLRYFLERS